MEGVENVAVKGESHPITGQIVCARVKLLTNETLSEFRSRMYAHCSEKLPRFKIPQKVFLVSENIHGARFKKMRYRIGVASRLAAFGTPLTGVSSSRGAFHAK